MQPNDSQWQSFYQTIKSKTGIDFNLYKAQQLQRRIVSMIGQQKCADLPDFGKWVASSPDNMAWFLDKMAINVSELFRNPEKWVEMEKIILPELLKKTSRLKCWSAGCSYGAEAHTLACILDARFPGGHSILGSDIDQAALAQARAGDFSKDDFKGVPAEYKKYFQQEGDRFKAIMNLKKYLKFQTGNLLADRFDSGYDLIMCRNVVIYFTEEAKDVLYKRFFDALKPGGILFVGSTERIFKSTDLGYETAAPFFYRKPANAKENTWRSAS